MQQLLCFQFKLLHQLVDDVEVVEERHDGQQEHGRVPQEGVACHRRRRPVGGRGIVGCQQPGPKNRKDSNRFPCRTYCSKTTKDLPDCGDCSRLETLAVGKYDDVVERQRHQPGRQHALREQPGEHEVAAVGAGAKNCKIYQDRIYTVYIRKFFSSLRDMIWLTQPTPKKSPLIIINAPFPTTRQAVTRFIYSLYEYFYACY